MKIKKRDWAWNLLPVLSLMVLILLWLWASNGENAAFPKPAAVWERFLFLLEKPVSKVFILGHVWASMKRVLIGLVLATVSGVLIGLLVGWNKTWRALIKPLIEMFRPLPALAWIPLATIWLGVGEYSKIFIVFIGAFMPVFVNTYVGVSLIPKINIDVARHYRASKMQMLFSIVLPSSLNAIVAGVKTSLGVAWMVVLAAEMISAKAGLGFLILRAQDVEDTPLVVIAMIFIGVIGALLSTLLTYVERRLRPWQTQID